MTEEVKEPVELTDEEIETQLGEPIDIDEMTPEQREEVNRIFKQLEKEPAPRPVDLTKSFKPGGTIEIPDPKNPAKLIIRTVGKEGLGVELLGKGRSLKNGFKISVNGYKMKMVMAKKKKGTLVIDK